LIRSSEIKIKRLRLPLLLILFGALVAAFILDLSLGSVNVPLLSVLEMLVGREPEKATWGKIFFLFRLPKAITATLAGAALSISGLEMQTLFRNPLAGPSVLGISAGASLGVAVVVLLAAAGGAAGFLEGLGLFGDLGILLAASIGSALVLMVILMVSRRIQSIMTLLILGILFGYAVNALVSTLLHFSISERIQAYISWTFGSFGNCTWSQLAVFIPVVTLFLIITQFTRKPLNALLLGESYARSMGLRVKETRSFIIINTAVLTGTVTAFCGPIAFLGIAIPHLSRSLFNTSDHRVLLPTTALLGSTVALIADIIAQLPGSQTVLPLSAVTALFGAPVIAWVILKRRNLRETFAG